MNKGKIIIKFESANCGYFFHLMNEHIKSFKIPLDKDDVEYEIKDIKPSYPRDN